MANTTPTSPNADSADGVRVGESPVPGVTLRRILRGHRGEIGRMAWSPCSKFLGSPSKDKTIRIWDTDVDDNIITLTGHEKEVLGLIWSPDELRIASAGRGNDVIIWDFPSGDMVTRLPTEVDKDVSCLLWSSKGDILVTAGSTGKIQFWDTINWKLLRNISGHNDFVNSIQWLFNEGYVVSGSANDDKNAIVWNIKTGTISARIYSSFMHKCLWFLVQSWKGSILAGTWGDKTIRI